VADIIIPAGPPAEAQPKASCANVETLEELLCFAFAPFVLSVLCGPGAIRHVFPALLFGF
jgi:hypothetical protein